MGIPDTNHLKHFLNYNKYGHSKAANMADLWQGKNSFRV